MLGLALAGITAAPKPANAWWHGYGWGVGIYAPPAHYGGHWGGDHRDRNL
jgi:hypothetical protein